MSLSTVFHRSHGQRPGPEQWLWTKTNRGTYAPRPGPLRTDLAHLYACTSLWGLLWQPYADMRTHSHSGCTSQGETMRFFLQSSLIHWALRFSTSWLENCSFFIQIMKAVLDIAKVNADTRQWLSDHCLIQWLNDGSWIFWSDWKVHSSRSVVWTFSSSRSIFMSEYSAGLQNWLPTSGNNQEAFGH